MKIVSIVGARPQFIKCAALAGELRAEHNHVIVHTGQHYDLELSGVFFDQLSIPEPKHNLGVGSGTHGYQIGQTIMAVEEVLLEEKPDLALIYGDTNSALAGALAALHSDTSIGHVEAGVRCWDRSHPEETNRILIDHCSDLLFCPTRTSVDNLIKENVTEGVYLTGDVMVDILLQLRSVAEQSNILQDSNLRSKEYLVVTMHRPGNTDNPESLKSIVEALCQIDGIIVFPMHPRADAALRRYGLYDQLSTNEGIKITAPLGYLDLIKLMNHADKVITDSGGMEKEAYILKVPCITMMKTTAWTETVEDGWNVMVGCDTERIVEMARDFKPSGEQTEDYGKGEACKNVKRAIDLMMK